MGKYLIYDYNSNNLFEQGDICKNLPKISPESILDLDNCLQLINTNKLGRLTTIEVHIRPILVNGVILSQTCDLRSGNNELFGELKEFKEGFSPKPYKRGTQIKKILRDDTRLHYFPGDEKIEILDFPKVLDLKSLFILPYDFLFSNINLFFLGRLFPEARTILKDKISRFFSRLEFENEIFLTDEELREQIKNHTGE